MIVVLKPNESTTMSFEELDRLRRLSLSDPRAKDVPNPPPRGFLSDYQSNFRPMQVGLRTHVWAEGWQQRQKRKVSGFNHFKLEWNCSSADRYG